MIKFKVLIDELGFVHDERKLYYDKQYAIHLAKNSAHHACTTNNCVIDCLVRFLVDNMLQLEKIRDN